uniref:Uncharacterized protein n=1 Tax=Siphoviridae sp. ctiPM17 TaxID=2825623 RepID=A0A8S5NV13_9CAUD|nr:MAG TPA: hypothetical protein [Siphoviridae sp. ctiPM17]
MPSRSCFHIGADNRFVRPNGITLNRRIWQSFGKCNRCQNRILLTLYCI